MTRARPAIAAVLASLLLSTLTFGLQERQPATADRPAIPGGDLRILGPDGAAKGSCPLKHTDVVANVAGFVGRTRVKQTFHNPLNEKIEAIYVFPLPDEAAVDEMVMTVGDRRIVGQVKPREEARAAYERAKAAGNVASLLDQERPNVFTQSVANVEPGARVVIEISYVESLKYEDGWYEFSFPTVVGPRYMPGASAGKQGDGVAADTTKVPDASRISPPITAQGTRAGHDISLTVNIDAGMEVKQVECKSHPVVENRQGDGRVTVALKNQETIPNKDFILRYRTATDQIADAMLTHKDERGSFFTLILQPPQKVQRKDAVGRELIFVLDTSGSMQGFPVTQAKFVMSKAIDNLGPQDTFNLITFSGDTSILWDAPRPNTPQNREEAQSFLASRQGRGGTEMMKAIDAALVQTRNVKPQAAGEPIRVVCFMTDGYVGNDMEIIDAVKKNAGTTRVFSFGIGNSVNRFLLDGMARAGRGEVEYVTLESKAQEAAERFYQRIDAPVLTDVAISWGAMGVADVYPAHIPDLFSNKPIIVHGRFTGRNKDGPPPTLRGNTANGKFERPIRWAPVEADGAARDALASLWARAKVSDLMFRDLAALQSGNFPEDLKRQITAVGTEFRLMTQFTSFVAVEELTITKGGQATKIAVPVEMPDGVSYEGIFGEKKQGEQLVLRGRALSTAGGLSGAYGGAVAGRRYANANNTQLYAIAPGQAAAQPQPAPLALPAAAAAPADGTVATRGAQPLTKAAPASRSDRQVRESERAEAVSELSDSEAVANGPAQPAPDASTKLAESLRGLAEKVQKQGKDGTLIAAGGVAVTGYKLDVMVYLSDASPKTLEALKKLGFEQSAESKAVRLVIGSIDVRKLFDLAKLDAVVSVRPVGA